MIRGIDDRWTYEKCMKRRKDGWIDDTTDQLLRHYDISFMQVQNFLTVSNFEHTGILAPDFSGPRFA